MPPKREILPHGNDAAFERRGRDEIRTAVDFVKLFFHTHSLLHIQPNFHTNAHGLAESVRLSCVWGRDAGAFFLPSLFISLSLSLSLSLSISLFYLLTARVQLGPRTGQSGRRIQLASNQKQITFGNYLPAIIGGCPFDGNVQICGENMQQ